MTVRVAINGFGRIGRLVYRASLASREIQVVAVNDLADAQTLAHLLRFDSVHGALPNEVVVTEDAFFVDGQEVKVLRRRDVATLPWRELGVDIVVESTGVFRDRKT